MSVQRALGIFIIVLALVVGIVPAYNNCTHDGKSLTVSTMGAMGGGMAMGATKTVPMKCLWTSRAAIAIAIPLGLVGLFLTFTRRKESNRVLAAMGVVTGAFAMALPTLLIGVCADPTASCNEVMKPALLLTGGLAIVASLVMLVNSERKVEAAA
jgi:Domain of unknown function (DUF4418)